MNIYDLRTGDIVKFSLDFDTLESEKEHFPWLKDSVRYYKILSPAGKGRRGRTYKAIPVDENGNALNVGFPFVALKVPNLGTPESSNVTNSKQDNWLAKLRDSDVRQLQLIRRRLENCKHANAIIDLRIELGFGQSSVITTQTVQPFLSGARCLKDWLTYKRIRPRDDNSWIGMTSWEQWRKYALLIAEAIESIHERRVKHCDIHPGNIMITDHYPSYSTKSFGKTAPYAVLIDFDSASLFTPSGDTIRVINHQYRAPERDLPLFVPTEQIDVYSFGKVLMYLATGQDSMEISIPPEERGNQRRAFIRRKIDQYNSHLLKESPRILDFIARCTAYDSTSRPTMSEIVRLLKAKPLSRDKIDVAILRNQFGDVYRKLKELPDSPRTQEIFLRIARSKVEEIADLANSRDSEQVQIQGTRNTIIDYLVLLFQALKKGDSWTTLTTPDVWVDSALGLDGRYLTASIEAIQNKASVRRFIAFSIEEVGEDWADQFADSLNATQQPPLQDLAQHIQSCLIRYRRDRIKLERMMPPTGPREIIFYRNRLILLIRAVAESIHRYGLDVSSATGEQLSNIEGLFFSLVPLASREEIRDRRIKNPASLIHMKGKAGDEWLLVMTDIANRVVNDIDAYRRPRLLGIRIFKSVFDIPQDRINSFEELLQEEAINVGPHLKELCNCFPKTAP